jgi:hypothetical protein
MLPLIQKKPRARGRRPERSRQGARPVPDLPEDVWAVIMDNFVRDDWYRDWMDKTTLSTLALVSRSIAAIATPRLYSHIEWTAYKTLISRPDLAQFVRYIHNPKEYMFFGTYRVSYAYNNKCHKSIIVHVCCRNRSKRVISVKNFLILSNSYRE